MSRNKFLNRYDIIARAVRKVLWHKTKDVHLIDDVCQSVSVICWKHERDLNDLPPERFEWFVVRVTLNQYRSWMRKRKPLAWPEGWEKGSSNEDPALTVERKEQSAVLLALLNTLSPLYRDIARLRIVEGWSHERIASEKGVPINTVKIQFHRAKAILRDKRKRYVLN